LNEEIMAKKTLSELDRLLGDFDVEEDDVEEMTTIRLDLAPCQGLGLMHVGRMYLHGGQYTVTKSVAADLGEMTRRGLSHEASITKQETAGRRRRNLDVHTPVGVMNPTTGAMQYF
jgi:hypothetical protein